MLEILFFAIAFAASFAGIAIFRRYGTAAGMLDIPNERSSHRAPTLRGAGVVIVFVCLSLYVAAALTTGNQISWGYVFGAIIVASVSWIDDIWTLPAGIRFIAHGSAAVILIAGSGPPGIVFIPGMGHVDLGLVYFLSFLWIVWLINAYNFMDGIDGIAGIQAVVAGLGWGLIGLISGDNLLFVFGGVVAFVSLGFLMYNWSPATVFMGDVGSAFLGFTFAAMPLIVDIRSEGHHFWLFLAALSFVWLFFFDTVFTFARRLLKGEKVWLAHRQHLYQRLVIKGFSHSSVSLLYGCSALLITAAFFVVFLFRGTTGLLLLLSYLIFPAVVVFNAFRKKV